MKKISFFLIILSTQLISNEAKADCRQPPDGKAPQIFCGNTQICHSDRRKENINDLIKPIHPKLCLALNNMVKKFGPIEIMAAFRKDNAARAGAKNSMHLQKPVGDTLALDVYRPADRKEMYLFLAGQKCIEKELRYNIYCNTGTIHMDMNVGLARKENTNYSGCRDFVSASCSGGGVVERARGYISSIVDDYFKGRASPAPDRKCYNAAKHGSCCGPKRKAAGLCTG